MVNSGHWTGKSYGTLALAYLVITFVIICCAAKPVIYMVDFGLKLK